jgi:hypothetical protein
MSIFRAFARRIIRTKVLPGSIREARSVVWLISYRHSIRPDEAGVTFVHDQSAIAPEKSRLKSLGYVVTGIAPRPSAKSPPALSERA